MTTGAKKTGALDASLEGWMFNAARSNLWRVARYMELDDLINDGYIVYFECYERYAAIAVNQRHFMGLFQKSYLNHITSITRKRRRDTLINDIAPANIDLDWWLSTLLGIDNSDGPIARLIHEAVFPVNAVISIFTTENGVLLQRRYPQRKWESVNHYICRLVGIDPCAYDIPAMMQSLLG